MDCNRDEAARAKEIAEKKLKEGDIAGAKKIALKAQSLCPGLQGLHQFIEILDVYICGEKKINGEVDYYGVLGVDPLADNETLRRRYRKLALDLHPDKNKSFGAEGAFKIISEAWSLLSDKAQRVAYDQKRNLRATYKKNINRNASATDATNGSDTSTHNSGSGLKAQKTTASTHPTPSSFTHSSSSSFKPQNTTASHQPTPVPPCPSKSITFWTECNQCNMQYQYFRVHFNQQVLCLNCQKPFYAVEIPSPPTPNSQRNVDHQMENKSSALRIKPCINPNAGTLSSAGVGSPNSPNVQRSSFFTSSSFRSVPASVGENANVVHPACQNLKRGREDGQAVVSEKEAPQRNGSAYKKTGARLASNAGSTFGKGVKAIKKSRTEVNVGGVQTPNQMGMGNGGAGCGNVSGYQKGSSGLCTGRVSATETVKPNSVRELPQLAMRNLLMAKSRMEIQKRLKEWSSEAALKASNKEGKVMEMEKPEAAVDGGNKDGSKNAEIMETKKPVRPKKSSLATSNNDSNEKAADVKLMSVPDPDFYDFDKDRMEKSFGGNQVWAAYDDEDGMPRYYALIHNVIATKPFKIHISWLNSKSNAELGPLDWVASGFPKTSGDFRVGKYEVYKNLNSFSHRVTWTKGPKGVIRIFPKKGDVWALYRNWSPEWNELTPDEVIHKYNVVEVLEDYNEEKGVVVAALVKVVGFKSVFRQHLESAEVQTIPREEMFRLSHQVPSYILTGQEAQNAPKGSLELDPAALPLELLQVITEEAKKTVTMENAKNATEKDAAKGAGKAMEDLHLD